MDNFLAAIVNKLDGRESVYNENYSIALHCYNDLYNGKLTQFYFANIYHTGLDVLTVVLVVVDNKIIVIRKNDFNHNIDTATQLVNGSIFKEKK